MDQFFAFNDTLNITNKQESDVFSFLAGGALYANTFAGESSYVTSCLPQINYTSIFLPFLAQSLTSIFELNEDFIEFALMPMQIMGYSNFQRKELAQEASEEIEKDTQKTIQIANELHERSGETFGFKSSDEWGKAKDESVDITRELLEQRQKGEFKQALQKIAFAKFGPVGAIVAGWAYDGKVSGGAVVDVVGQTVVAKTAQSITSALAGALDLNVGYATFGLSAVIGSALNEAYEVASGLDIHYGFGGELAGIVDGVGLYTPKDGFLSGLARMFGLKDKEYKLVDKYGNERGYRTSSGAVVEYGKNDFSSYRKSGFKALLNNPEERIGRLFGDHKDKFGISRDKNGDIISRDYEKIGSKNPADRYKSDFSDKYFGDRIREILRDKDSNKSGSRSDRSFGEKTGLGRTSRGEKSRDRQRNKHG